MLFPLIAVVNSCSPRCRTTISGRKIVALIEIVDENSLTPNNHVICVHVINREVVSLGLARGPGVHAHHTYDGTER